MSKDRRVMINKSDQMKHEKPNVEMTRYLKSHIIEGNIYDSVKSAVLGSIYNYYGEYKGQWFIGGINVLDVILPDIPGVDIITQSQYDELIKE